jgi:DNA-binding transcriptional LysR family regulator
LAQINRKRRSLWYASVVRQVELRHLAAMVAVAEEGSFGRAAERLGYTQSTVSQQIAALEKGLGGAVFDRPGGPNPVRITPLGALVLAHGRALLTTADAMAAAVDRFKAGDGRVDIGTFQSVSNVVLPRVVHSLRQEQPGCDIRLFEEETDQPRVTELDLMFFDGRVNGEVEHHKLFDDPYLLVARRGDLPDGPVQLSRLDGAPMVAHPSICDQARMELGLARNGVQPQIVFRTVGNEAVLSMVRAGMGWALLPWLTIHGANAGTDESLQIHHLEPGLPPREIYLLWQANRSHSPLAARAIQTAIAVANDVARHIPQNER